VADSVVSKGRETLERAIKTIESTERWGARVVYGDTDSVFVLLKGKSRDDAFAIGQEIAEAVTLDNPKPVKLKFEKVRRERDGKRLCFTPSNCRSIIRAFYRRRNATWATCTRPGIKRNPFTKPKESKPSEEMDVRLWSRLLSIELVLLFDT
jgi:hypothetical protein